MKGNKIKIMAKVDLKEGTKSEILGKRYYVYEKMIEKYGKKDQMLIAVEECSELQKAILKYLRGRCNTIEISEEMADVEIMLEQLYIMLDNHDEVKFFKEKKIERTSKLYLENNKDGSSSSRS